MMSMNDRTPLINARRRVSTGPYYRDQDPILTGRPESPPPQTRYLFTILDSIRQKIPSEKTLLSIFILTIGIGLAGFAIVTILHRIPKQQHLFVSEEYDIIIIGGGPAGSVLSKLLTDKTEKRILLIEAGDASQANLGGKDIIPLQMNTRNLTPFDVPFYWANVANTGKYHWNYPDANVAKALGGCGIHNAMLYIRALPSDIERWKVKDWTWDTALESYKKMEDFDGPESSFHGKNGPIRTSRIKPGEDEISERFLEACEALGVPKSEDFNAPNARYGAGYYHFNIRDGIRDSAARAFLGPLLQRKDRGNFELYLNTVAKRLVLNKKGNAVEQVHVYRSHNAHESIQLAKNGTVVLTAGAINTPKLLLLSGLGPRGDLERLQIPVQQNLPMVGKNLQDHPVIGILYKKTHGLSPERFQQHVDRYFSSNFNCSHCYGLLGSPGIGAGAFLIPPGSTLPELQLTLFSHQPDPHFTNTTSPDSVLLFTVALLKPDARNSVYIECNDHHQPPRVRPVQISDQAPHLSARDARHLAWGVHVVREIVTSASFDGICKEEIVPGSEIRSYQEIENWVHQSHYRNSHWVGSASMGNSSDYGVVDHHLRVFGVSNLRIADASVIPLIPNGNVHSTVLLVASRAADFISSDAN